MDTEYKIREASESDLHAVYKLWLDLMDFHKGQHAVFDINSDAEDLLLAMLKEKFASPETKLFIAVKAEKAIGLIICRFQIASKVFRLYRKGYIGETMVAQEFQAIGVGEALYRSAEAYFVEKNADHIELQVSVKNPKAMTFWEKRGFEVSTNHMIRELK